MKKFKRIIEINQKAFVTNISAVNKMLYDGWLVNKDVVCYDNCVHYLLEKEMPDDENK